MTTENQIAIAEACGYYKHKGAIECWMEPLTGLPLTAKDLFQCYNSLDSLQSAVLAQDEEFQFRFAYNLMETCRIKGFTHVTEDGEDVFMFHQLTVADWQESFVETLRQLGRLK